MDDINMHQRSQFRNLWDAGYRRLVPIIPPHADISERSSLYKRPGSVGKAPGVKGRDGLWRGFDWLKHETTESDLELWASWGAGVGIRMGAGLVAVDVDTKNGELCERIAAVIQKHLGDGPVRFGNRPKFLVLFHCDEPIKYDHVKFDDGLGGSDGKAPPRVEILGEGKQIVAHGVHPVTDQPYEWPQGLVAASSLPAVSRAALNAFMDDLVDVLPQATRSASRSLDDRPAPPQDTLKGDLDLVRQAIKHLPNTSEIFPTYDDYIEIGAAIKGATQDDPDLGEQLWLQWAGRYDAGEFRSDIALDHYRRIIPPYKLGARYLFDYADKHSGGAFNSALAFFAPVTPESLAAEEDIWVQAAEADRQRAIADAAIAWMDPIEWEGEAPPPRQWIVEGVLPAGEVALLTGEGGVGKTLLAQQIATAVSRGIPVLGAPTRQGRVMMFLCEDDAAELNRRQRAINASMCLDMRDISGRMRIASRKHHDNLLVTFERGTAKMARTPLWQQIMRGVEEFQPDLVVIDTIADVFGGSEIDRQQVRQFVQAGLGAFCAATGCAVLALGHPSKSGMQTKDGTSGSTAWHASVRARLFLDHATKERSGPLRKLKGMKANYAESGGEWTLRYDRGAFTLLTATGAVAEAAAVPDTIQTLDEAIMHAARQTRDMQRATSLARNSAHFAPKVWRSLYAELFAAHDLDAITAATERLLGAGLLREDIVGRRDNRHPVRGIVPAVSSASVFD